MYPMRLSNDIWDILSFCRDSISERTWDYCKMTFIIVRGFAERQILKKWKWHYLLNWVEYFDKLLHKHWYWQDLTQEIWNVTFHWSRFCRAPNSEKLKMALSLELWRILWWNFAYTLMLTRRSQWDWQMTFGIGRGFAEVQILALSLELSGILWWNFAYTLILTRCTPWDYQMTFEIGWVFAEIQFLKKKKNMRLLQNDIYHRSMLCRAPNSEKVKMALSLELSGIFW